MNDELCGHKIKMLAEPCLHCELKKRYDRIENLESLTQGIDWDKWHDAAEILASQEQWRRVAGELEQKLSAERERLINSLLYLVPMASMELTREYLREELAKETPHEEA